jgi:hypothetical protein
MLSNQQPELLHPVLQCKIRNAPAARRLRRMGLAPVELVLSIPLILFVMALSVIVGNAACWKIRASVVARNEIWSNRRPRSDNPEDPRPAGWPAHGGKSHSSQRSLADLNDPAFQNPLVNGPLPNVTVNDRLLDPTLTVRHGASDIKQTPPMLAKMGDYSFNVDHPLIDGPWAYWQTGQWGNGARRFPALYPDTPPHLPEEDAFRNSVDAVKSAPFLPDLAVLDGDQELHDWFYPDTFDPPIYMDFHPRVRFCSMDSALVRAQYITDPRRGLLVRIANVPRSITNTFLRMYRDQLRILQNTMPPPANATMLEAELEQNIQTLEAYLATL